MIVNIYDEVVFFIIKINDNCLIFTTFAQIVRSPQKGLCF